MKKILITSLVAGALTGCSGLHPLDKTLPPAKTVAASLAESWRSDDEPSVSGMASIVLYTPSAAPHSVQNKAIQLNLRPGVTLRDVAAMLAYKGVSLIITDPNVGNKTFFLPVFSGTVGQLLDLLSGATNTHFIWRSGALYAVDTVRIGVSIPQDEFVAEKLDAGLKSLGAKGLSSSEAGMLLAEVQANQLRDLRALIRRITDNAAIVTTQVAIMSVNLTKDQKEGVDWSRLQLAAGSDAANLMNSLNPNNSSTYISTNNSSSSSGTTATGTPTSSTSTAINFATQALKSPVNAGLLYSGNALRGALSLNGLTMIGFMNLLRNEFRAETLQNVTMRAATGGSGKFSSNTKVPYVKSVSTTTVGTNTTATTGSADFDTTNDGITLDLKPMYDAHAGTVSLSMQLKLETVMGYKDLTAGNGVGTVTQRPITAERSLDAKMRMRPGQLTVVGGLIFDQISDTRTGLPALPSQLDGRSYNLNRYELFVVLRPTVSVLEAPQERSTTYESLPAAAEPIE